MDCLVTDIADFLCNHRLCSVTFQTVYIFSHWDIEIVYCNVEEGITWKLSISLTLLLLSPVGKVLVFCDSMDDRF